MTFPIGIFDSGVGGLSVLQEIALVLPNENLIYVGDTENIPYGNKSVNEIRLFADRIVQFLLSHHVKIIVVACNTASAAALTWLREKYSEMLFIGIEPAIKPGVKSSENKCIGVLATEYTLNSERYFSLVKRYSSETTLYQDPCLGLVSKIENGKHRDTETQKLLEKVIYPMLEKGVDIFILGCTHYPFVKDIIEKLINNNGIIINPAPAIAEQTQRILKINKINNKEINKNRRVDFFATGNIDTFSRTATNLLNQEIIATKLNLH